MHANEMLESSREDREAIHAAESPFTEIEELEFAAELLETHQTAELEQVLRGLLQRSASAVGRPLARSTTAALASLLKRAVRHTLPSLTPGAGTQRLSPPPARAGEILGLELEGLSHEDQEFEAAKQMVRLAGAAANHAANAPQSSPPDTAARQALAGAAVRHAPGLVQRDGRHRASSCQCHTPAGRWERHGQEIVLHGL